MADQKSNAEPTVPDEPTQSDAPEVEAKPPALKRAEILRNFRKGFADKHQPGGGKRHKPAGGNPRFK